MSIIDQFKLINTNERVLASYSNNDFYFLPTEKVSKLDVSFDDYYKYRFELRLGSEIIAKQSDLNRCVENVKYHIHRELYGDLLHDLAQLELTLYRGGREDSLNFVKDLRQKYII
jgi:hypothetical protein